MRLRIKGTGVAFLKSYLLLRVRLMWTWAPEYWAEGPGAAVTNRCEREELSSGLLEGRQPLPEPPLQPSRELRKALSVSQSVCRSYAGARV